MKLEKPMKPGSYLIDIDQNVTVKQLTEFIQEKMKLEPNYIIIPISMISTFLLYKDIVLEIEKLELFKPSYIGKIKEIKIYIDPTINNDKLIIGKFQSDGKPLTIITFGIL